MTKKTVKEPTIKGIWAELWADYKRAWVEAWNKYKTLIGPFIEGTANYIWLLVAGLLELVTRGLYESGKILVQKLIDWIKKI